MAPHDTDALTDILVRAAVQRYRGHAVKTTFTFSPAGSHLRPPARDPCPLFADCVSRTLPTRERCNRKSYEIRFKSWGWIKPEWNLYRWHYSFCATAASVLQGTMTSCRRSNHVCHSSTPSLRGGRGCSAALTYRQIDDLPFGDGGATYQPRSEAMAVIKVTVLFKPSEDRLSFSCQVTLSVPERPYWCVGYITVCDPDRVTILSINRTSSSLCFTDKDKNCWINKDGGEGNAE